jgi:tryptophan-rich sensory protein
MMALAAWLVWRAGEGARLKTALTLYGVQLVLNALWSWLFFGWQLGALALVEVVVFWCVIAATALAFWRIHRGAGLLMLPYLVWVAFATALNAALVRLNSQVLGF